MEEETKEKEFVKELTPKSQDFPSWYVDVVRKAELADYTMLKGCMVIRPYGYELWENIRDGLDRRIKALGHKNAYFPLFVPESLLRKEAEHVEGFAPEVAWVTHGGAEELEERLAIRPTSEAIICSIYAKWIQSYRDLPLLINQWANVVRWEKVTRLFLRTTEFLWQEGHTCHRTEEEAEEEASKMLFNYEEFLREELAIPAIIGEKTAVERFAGAKRTYTVEALMGDGRALQAATSHNLGQNFARAFGIKYLDEDQVEKFVWQTSWGMTTRVVGALIMVHGDDEGLRLPPRVAPLQAIMVPILYADTREKVLEKVTEILGKLRKFRVEADVREGFTPGWKFNHWELKGVPVRIELGPRDLQRQQAVLVRRDTRQKTSVAWDELPAVLENMLNEVHEGLLQQARDFQHAHTHEVEDFEQLKEIMERRGGFVVASWCGKNECELGIKEETKATIRCVPLKKVEQPRKDKCIYCGSDSLQRVYFARAY